MFLSDYIKDGRKGHVNFDFVDVQLDSDNADLSELDF